MHNVKKILPNVLKLLTVNNKDLVEKVADRLGILAEAGGKTKADTTEKALNDCIRFLHEDRAPKSNKIEKYSAVLVIKNFSKKMPIITFNKMFDQKKHFREIFHVLSE